MDIERLASPHALAFLLQVVADKREPPDVRRQVVRWLRNGEVPPAARGTVADVLLHVLRDEPSSDLRLQAANALAEFTDVGGVLPTLGAVALNRDESADLRYGAFISLQSAWPSEECVALLRSLSADELLGPSAHELLKLWRVQ